MTPSLALIGSRVQGHVCTWFGDFAETGPGDSPGQEPVDQALPTFAIPGQRVAFFQAAARPKRARCARRRTQLGQAWIRIENSVAVDDGELSPRGDGGNG